MAARSVLAGRLMAAANRAFRSRPVSTTTKERLELETRSYFRTQNELDDLVRESCARAVNTHNRITMKLANPYRGPADGDVLYDLAWKNNLSFLVILCTCFGLSHTLVNLPRQRCASNVSTA